MRQVSVVSGLPGLLALCLAATSAKAQSPVPSASASSPSEVPSPSAGPSPSAEPAPSAPSAPIAVTTNAPPGLDGSASPPEPPKPPAPPERPGGAAPVQTVPTALPDGSATKERAETAPSDGPTSPTTFTTSGTTAALDSSTGPTIELAEEHVEPTTPVPNESLSARRASASVFSSMPNEHTSTTIGGYAQFNLTSVRRGFDGKFDTNATIRRLVLMFSHHITDDVAAYTELEWENAIACATCSGSVEIEQAYIDWRLFEDALTLRSGLILIPMGLLNLWHEPPVFHGVDRPQIDQVLIPTTWRELGAGFTGLLADNLEYQLYLTTTFVPSQLGPNGFVSARQLGSNSISNAGALSARVDYEPILGLSVSASGFASDAGANGDFYNATGERVDFTYPILGGSLTGRFLHRGLEARAVGAAFWMPESGALMNARRADGGLIFPNSDRVGSVPTRMVGGMVEAAYDVLRLTGSAHQLLPFVRAETYDTQSAVPDAFRPNGALTVQEWTLGLTYRPMRQFVFKSDVQLRDRRTGLDELQVNVGMGYML